MQRSPLHLAALKHGGGSRVFSALCGAVSRLQLDLEALLDLPDGLNQTARQYATLHFSPRHETEIRSRAGLYHQVLSRSDEVHRTLDRSPLLTGKEKNSEVMAPRTISDNKWNKAGVNGGWVTHKQRGLELQPRGRCDITEFWGAPSAAELAVVLNEAQPVVFRNALQELGIDRSLWSKATLLQKYGAAATTVTDIPYKMSDSSLLDMKPKHTTLSLREYVARHIESDEHQEDVPLYLFSKAFAAQTPQLFEDISEVIELVDSVPGIGPLTEGQFFLGPAGSGAPMHFHSLALNALHYGRKRWTLLPAKDALYSHKPGRVFFEKDLPILRLRNNQTDSHFHRTRERDFQVFDQPGDWQLMEFTQQAGDVVYIPEFFSHATINIETSIGMAFELENYNEGVYSLSPDTLRAMQNQFPGAVFGRAL